jgi:muconolactone delta-isomerase
LSSRRPGPNGRPTWPRAVKASSHGSPGYEAKGICKQIYPRVGRGAVAIFDVESNDVLHRILNEWADMIPAHFDTYPLVDLDTTKKLLAAQVAAKQNS